MARKTFNVKIRRVPLYDQQDEFTWDGLPSSCNISTFMDYGCALCSAAMMASWAERKSVTPADVYARGATYDNSPEIKDWGKVSKKLDLGKMSRPSISKVARSIIEYKEPVIIKVSGPHFFVAYGFNGTLPVDTDGQSPYYSSATADMILIKDPWKGNCDTLQEIFDKNYYGDEIEKVLIP